MIKSQTMKNLSILIAVTLSSLVYSQFKLTGTIIDESTQKPAVLTELLLIGENQEYSNISDEKGFYSFENLADGTYTLQLIQDFEPIYTEEIKLDTDLEKNISVQLAQSIALDEAVITSKVFRKKSDRFIFDVAASPISKGNDAFQLLKETPLVSTTDDKSLKILGKSNAVIYINGQKSNMDAEAIIQMLKNTNAQDIQRIEVITLPGSEFQAEANEGIINIVMKKAQSDGYNGTIRLADEQTYYNHPRANIGLNLRQGKFAVNTNLYANGYREREYYKLSNGDSEFTNETEGNLTDPNLSLGGNLNLDYALTENQNLGLNYNFHYNKSFDSTFETYSKLNGIATDKNVKIEDAQTRNHALNLNYEIKTDSLGSKFSSNFSYLYYNRNMEGKTETFPLNEGAYNAFKQVVPQIIHNFGANLDYKWMMKNEDSFVFGANYNSTETDNDTRQDNFENGNFVNDPILSNHFTYRENIIGLFANFEKQFSENFSGKLGVRYEFTHAKGEVIGKEVSFTNDYANFLPFLNLNYTIHTDHNLSYSFASRVKRPAFWELNPTRTYFTPTNYIQNNPFMKSSKNYKQELNYMYKGAYFINMSYSYADDASGQLPLQGYVTNDETGEQTAFLRYIRTNYGTEQKLGLTVGMNKGFFAGIWETNYSLNLFFEKIDGEVSHDPTYIPRPGFTETLNPYLVDSDNTSFYLQANNTIRLSANKDWFLGINYWYLSSEQTELGRLNSMQSLDLSLKKIWKNWTFILEGNDLLNTVITDVQGTQPNGNFNNIHQIEYNRGIVFKLSYSFGNQKLKKAREVDAANSSIKSRT